MPTVRFGDIAIDDHDEAGEQDGRAFRSAWQRREDNARHPSRRECVPFADEAIEPVVPDRYGAESPDCGNGTRDSSRVRILASSAMATRISDRPGCSQPIFPVQHARMELLAALACMCPKPPGFKKQPAEPRGGVQILFAWECDKRDGSNAKSVSSHGPTLDGWLAGGPAPAGPGSVCLTNVNGPRPRRRRGASSRPRSSRSGVPPTSPPALPWHEHRDSGVAGEARLLGRVVPA